MTIPAHVRDDARMCNDCVSLQVRLKKRPENGPPTPFFPFWVIYTTINIALLLTGYGGIFSVDRRNRGH